MIQNMCVGCGTNISRGSKRCRPCDRKHLWHDPEQRRNLLEALAANQRRRANGFELAIKSLLEALFDEVIFQYVPDEDMSPGIYDFYIVDIDTIVEFDGTYWHGDDPSQKKDMVKEQWALDHGYSFLRITETGVKRRRYMQSFLKELLSEEIF